MPRLPGLNYGTPLTIDDLDHLEQTYTDEFRRRTLAVLGSYLDGGASFGILSPSDPINATATTDPFYIEQDDNDSMRINVYPGAAYTESGMLVELTEPATSVEMVRTGIGQQNVVTIEYTVVDDTDTLSKTRFNRMEARRTRIADETNANPSVQTILRVHSLIDWQNDVTFPPERRRDIIVLALVTVIAADNTAGKEVYIDLSRTNLTVTRPWFSPVDLHHRMELGTGSADVPHNLGLNDLSQGNLSLYDQLVNYGMIIGRDQSVPGVPGTLCMELVTGARVKTDVTGNVTGTLSQRYITLTRFPVRLLGCYSVSDPTDEILVRHMPHSDILLLDHDEYVPANGFRIMYSTVAAGEPLPDSLLNDEVHVRQPDTTEEMIVSGGRGITEIQPRFVDQFGNARARISIGTAAAIPKQHRIWVDGDGQLLASPQHVLCATKLDDIGTGVYTFETELLGSARLRVGLQGVSEPLPGTVYPTLQVKLRLTGTDDSGNTVTEDLTFSAANYTPPSIGSCSENSRNWQVTNTVFATVTSMTVVQRTDDGANTAACVYGDLEPTQTAAIRDACPLAEVMWDGGRICRVQDIRPVSSRLEVPSRTSPVEIAGQAMMSGMAATDVTDVSQLLADDMRDPWFFRLYDPLRFLRQTDGLRSAGLPQQPGVESSELGLAQDRYVSQALRLLPGAGRKVHVALLGRDAQQNLLNGIDGITPNLEYRWATTSLPYIWTDWTVALPIASANGTNFRIEVTDDTAFKFQVRVKASLAGIVVVQFSDIGTGLGAFPTITGTPTTNQLAIWTDSDALEGDAKLYWNNGKDLVIENNGSLGGLQLYSNTAGLIPFIHMRNTAAGVGTDWYIRHDEHKLHFMTEINSDYKITFMDTPRIGINTTAPVRKLHIVSHTNDSELIRLEMLDPDAAFIDYRGTAAATTLATISTLPNEGTQQGWLQISVNGAKRWIRFWGDPTS